MTRIVDYSRGMANLISYSYFSTLSNRIPHDKFLKMFYEAIDIRDTKTGNLCLITNPVIGS